MAQRAIHLRDKGDFSDAHVAGKNIEIEFFDKLKSARRADSFSLWDLSGAWALQRPRKNRQDG